MSELKSYDAYICENDMPIEDLPIVKDAVVRSASNKEEDDWSDYAQNFEVYKKSEADNVIAELKDDCAYWKTMSQKCADDNEVMAKQRAEAFKRECHHKNKRCLAMAKWCEIGAKFQHNNVMQFDNPFYIKRAEWLEKWHKRWLELAEKFKETK